MQLSAYVPFTYTHNDSHHPIPSTQFSSLFLFPIPSFPLLPQLSLQPPPPPPIPSQTPFSPKPSPSPSTAVAAAAAKAKNEKKFSFSCYFQRLSLLESLWLSPENRKKRSLSLKQKTLKMLFFDAFTSSSSPSYSPFLIFKFWNISEKKRTFFFFTIKKLKNFSSLLHFSFCICSFKDNSFFSHFYKFI